MNGLDLDWLELPVLVRTEVEGHVWRYGTSFESSSDHDTYTRYLIDAIDVEFDWILR